VEKYLNRCIDSILCQTYTNLEIILVDDGATDSSGKICDEYKAKDDRIKVIHKLNGGLSSARNAGLDMAKGDYIGFVDSDDYIASDMYELLVNELNGSEKDIANVMHVRAYESGKNEPSCVPHVKNETFSSKEYLEELLLHLGDVSVWSKLFPKKLIADLRFVQGVLNEDLLFMIELIKKIENIRFIGKVGYYYFVREDSITSRYSKAFVDMQKNSLKVLEYVEKNYPILKRQASRFALYQNMVYLLDLPQELANKANQVYCSALSFVRKNTLRNLFNKYLRLKDRVILCVLMFAPKTLAKIFQNKKRKNK
jgi:glycosyltransferase involved in cell wall biosynthesis